MFSALRKYAAANQSSKIELEVNGDRFLTVLLPNFMCVFVDTTSNIDPGRWEWDKPEHRCLGRPPGQVPPGPPVLVGVAPTHGHLSPEGLGDSSGH